MILYYKLLIFPFKSITNGNLLGEMIIVKFIIKYLFILLTITQPVKHVQFYQKNLVKKLFTLD